MREIKFKMWDIKDKKFGEPLLLRNDINVNDVFIDDRYLFLQFTGLKDKNGKDIYEGDIVQCWKEEIRIINFDSGGFGSILKEDEKKEWLYINSFEWLIETIENKSIEIIGNIYENPELLTN